jgi:Type II CAAX prenyl endopeptidase Rce1-like
VKPLIDYLKDYLRNISVKSLVFTFLFIALLITLNYTVGIERRIRDIRPWYLSWVSFFFFYGFVLFFAWAVQFSFPPPGAARPSRFGEAKLGRRFLLLLLVAPLFFASKMVHWDLSALLPGGWHYPWNTYALTVLQLPAKLLILLLLLYGCWRLEKGHLTGLGLLARRASVAGNLVAQRDAERLSFWGMTTRNFTARPYLLMLLFLLPLVALASTQHDFLHTYPKLKNIAFIGGYTRTVWPWRLLYEISYGLDFVSIELFFRGFLVIGLARYAGQYAILPMAAFYCTIHFGKPLGECISSFFGGLALGVVAWRTRSILGGLIVHLGLAWMMEVGGWLGNLFF